MIDLTQAVSQLGNGTGLFRDALNTLPPRPHSETFSAPLDSLELSQSDMNDQTVTVHILLLEVRMQVSSYVGDIDGQQEIALPVDFSPEATARRVFDFSIGMFSVYQAGHPEESADTLLAGFEALVRDAIDKGFDEALTILQETGRLNGETDEFVSKTYAVLQKLLEEFFNPQKSGATEPPVPHESPVNLLESQASIRFQYGSREGSFTKNESGQLSQMNFSAEMMSLTMSYRQESVGQESSLSLIA